MKYKAGGHYEGELSQGLREGVVPRDLWVCVCSGGQTTNLACLTLDAGKRQELIPPFSAHSADEPIRAHIQRAFHVLGCVSRPCLLFVLSMLRG